MLRDRHFDVKWRHTHHAVFLVLIAALICIGAVPIPPNIRVTGHVSGIQHEEQVRFCPNDSNIILINHRDFRLGYAQIGVARSTNGGATWSDALIPVSQQRFKLQSRPGLTVTSNGTFVLSHTDYQSGNLADSSYVSILTAPGCGETLLGPHTVEDTIGPYLETFPLTVPGIGAQTVYGSWTRWTGTVRLIMFARSEDAGISWSLPEVVSTVESTNCPGFPDGTYPEGHSQPLAGIDGAVYVFWVGRFVAPPPACVIWLTIQMNKSTDGGITWGAPRTLAQIGSGRVVTAADLSGGPHSGNLYFQFMDYQVSTEPYHSEIYFSRSLDTGHTWSPRMRVNDDPLGVEVNQFLPWMVSNEDGVLASIWYDERTDPGHTKYDVFAAYSYDGGASWTSNHRVSSVPVDPALLGGSIGEQISLACSHDKVVAVWTDTRDGDQDVWSATWHLPLTDPRLLTNSGVTLTCGDSLKWATAWKENEDRYLLQASTSPDFVADDLILSGFMSTTSFEIPPGLPDDTLYWRIKAYRAPYGVSTDSTAFSSVPWFRYTSCSCACDCHRDPFCDTATNIADIVSVVDVAFNNAAEASDPKGNCPYIRSDIDCNSFTDVLDVVLMVGVVDRNQILQAGLCGTCD